MLGFEAAGSVDAVETGVTGTSIGDGVTALRVTPWGYAEYVLASIWAKTPENVSWIDAGATRRASVVAEAIALSGGPERVNTLSDPVAHDFGVTLSEPASEGCSPCPG